jgi:hypothetical protein
MIDGKHVAVVSPAYYSALRPLERTALEIPDAVDERILFDNQVFDNQVLAQEPQRTERAMAAGSRCL